MADQTFERAVTVDFGPVTIGEPEPRQWTLLEQALAQACEFARWYGVEKPITPDDFAIQRSPSGHTHATHVGLDVVVVVRPGADPVFGIAELDWIHYLDTTDNAPCDQCAVPPLGRAAAVADNTIRNRLAAVISDTYQDYYGLPAAGTFEDCADAILTDPALLDRICDYRAHQLATDGDKDSNTAAIESEEQ